MSRSVAILLRLLVLVAAGPARLAAQPGAPAEAVPFAPGGSPVTAAQRLIELERMQLAHDFGLTSLAIEYYRAELARGSLSLADRTALIFKLVDALLDDGDVAGAERALNEIADKNTAAWNLRAGLIASYQRRAADARGHGESVNREADKLNAAERVWWLFLQGLLRDFEGDPVEALNLYNRAVAAAPPGPQRTRFEREREYAQLRLASVTPESAAALRASAEQARSPASGYEFARLHAIALFNLGQPREAQAYVQQQLAGVPAEMPEWRDRFLLLQGLVATGDPAVRAAALRRLVGEGGDLQLQRIALQLYARVASTPEQLRLLNEQLAGQPRHRIRDDLLMLRAKLALEEGTSDGYRRAADDANELLDKYPLSPWRAQAFVTLASVDWDQQRYVRAADFAAKARAEIGPGPVSARLAVLAAEAYYRAGNFRSAADAYETALAEKPAGISAGELMFQRVQAEIAATDFRAPEASVRPVDLLDRLAREPEFAVGDRWRAEWNLARAFRAAGRADAALPRVERLLASGPAGAELPAELRIRMEWLRATLTLEAGQPAVAARLAEALAAGPALAGVAEGLQREVRSQAALIVAQAYFAVPDDARAVATLTKLRADFPDTEAAAESYLIQADTLQLKGGAVGQTIELLNRLAAEFPRSAHAPYALFKSAELELSRGGDQSSRVANDRRLEALVRDYPASPWVMSARLLQGDLFRDLGDYAAAARAFDVIVKDPRWNNLPGGLVARIRLADVQRTLSREANANFQLAASNYQLVRDHPNASLDLRLEAGYKLGSLLHDEPSRAQLEWFTTISPLLAEPRAAEGLGPKGTDWLGEIILALEPSFRAQGKLADAQAVRRLGIQLRAIADQPAGRAGP